MSVAESVDRLEAQLDDIDPAVRAEAFETLLAQVETGEVALPQPDSAVNVHAHTFFSYNGYGCSPTSLVWRFRRRGLAVAGVVDFDTLDAVDEFRGAAARAGLKACAGLETRVFFPEFREVEINSPGEPGIAYHMGAGFVASTVPDPPFLDMLRQTAQRRTRQILELVNTHLHPLTVDFDEHVLPRTPHGNATERHLCEAYEARGREIFPEDNARAAFWAQKLDRAPETLLKMFTDAPAFQGLIRAVTMKQGGVGYVQPLGSEFPPMDDFNAFILRCGAIPTVAWLDGLSSGEQAMERLLHVAMQSGVGAINIIPDRNWNIPDPDLKRRKVHELDRVISLAESLDLPILVGTEINAHGQKLVDDFDVPELASYSELFLAGAHIVYGHTRLEEAAGIGYASEWAHAHLRSPSARNTFYRRVGEVLAPDALIHVAPDMTPDELLAAIGPPEVPDPPAG